MKFSKSVMQSTAKIINKNLKDGKGYPSSVTMKDMDNKTGKLKDVPSFIIFNQ